MKRRPRAVKLLFLFLIGATGGPDASDYVFSSSDEADGPPHAMLDLSAEDDLALGADGTVEVELPFAFDWYGESWTKATIAADGALLFDGVTDAPSCPGTTGSWSGVAAFWDTLDAGEVRAGTVGRYPNRAFAVEWSSPHATAGGGMRGQVWLLEASAQAVIALDDVTFSDASGDASADGGVLAVIGAQGGAGTGLAWACAGGIADEQSAWFSVQGTQPDAPERYASQVDGWIGTETRQYAARSLGGGDINGDGFGDLVIGNQDDDVAWLVLGGADRMGGTTADADAAFAGVSGSDLSAAIALGDLDGDGLDDVALGAPSDSTGGSSAGAAFVLAGDGVGADATLPDDADLGLIGAEAGADAGAALATGDLDGDGYADLAVGAPSDDSAATDAGTVWLWSGSSSPWVGTADLSTAPSLTGGTARDRAGWSLAAEDLDGDGAAELLVGAPYAASGAGAEGGLVFAIGGGARSGSLDLATASWLIVDGDAKADHLGVGLAAGDVDGDGAGDLLLGAPLADSSATNGGALYVFYDATTLSGSMDAGSADASIAGVDTSANAGFTATVWDANQDGVDDMVVGVPNAASSAAGGGLAVVFTTPPAGGLGTDSADNVLLGDHTAGALGTALAVLGDHNGDGYVDLAVGEPYAAGGGLTGVGVAAIWSMVPSFLDEDGDGFVSADAGGLDCDDGDAATNPSQGEVADNLTDDDCDGWIDDVLVYRGVASYWSWDLDAELGAPTVTDYDFEDATEGDDVSTLYAGSDLSFEAAGNCVASASIWGSAPAGDLGLRVTTGTRSNALKLEFAEDIDAIGFQVLDGASTFFLTARADGVDRIAELPFRADGDNRSGGVFAGFTFASGVDELEIELASGDGWGLDDLQIVWAADTDRDLDGWTDLEGDCDDDDADLSPDQDEVLGDGLDNDCDGVIDGGGATALFDEDSWITVVDETLERVDFEDLVEGADAAESYADLGVRFSSPLTVTRIVDGVAPRQTQGGEIDGASLDLAFDELQPAVGLWVLAGAGTITVQGGADGLDLYDFSVDVAGEGVDEGVFVGLIFDYGVTELHLSADDPGDVWGIDDVQFVVLGQDDADGDGWTELEGDCDDADGSAYPGGAEVWYDGVDGDCGGDSDYDADADGSDASAGGGLDCDDGDDAVSPYAEEVWYDGEDSDCGADSDYDADADGHDDADYGGDDCDDGDEEVSPDADETWYDGTDSDCAGDNDYDADGDGAVPAEYAIEGSGLSSDCDDGDDEINPDADETWYDGVDSDCDGASDADADGDGHDALLAGGDDCDDDEALTYPGSTHEVCYDGQDSDCAGDSDFDCDADGYDTEAAAGEDCDDDDPSIFPGAADAPRDGIDGDCDGALEYDDDGDGYDGAEDGGDDCDDGDAAIHPDAVETWYDGVDSDCDEADDDDADADGVTAIVAGGTDCDDEDASVHPGATDYWYDDIDQDCDGLSDFDADGDGYAASWYAGTDCDDDDALIFPGATETWYDGVDQDCDDNDGDADGDGHDALAVAGDDCDDADAAISPSEDEIAADGVDQDCDGIDDVDADGDGKLSLEDCDDGDPARYPGATEICYDGVDQDCGVLSDSDCDGDGYDASASGGDDCDDDDASAHPGASERWYDGVDRDCAGGDDYDADSDGYAALAWGGADCDDADAGSNPGVSADDCGNGDEDCDDVVDEDCGGGGDTDETDDSGGSGSGSSGGSGGEDSAGGDDSGGTGGDTGGSGGSGSGGSGSGGSGSGGGDSADPLPDDETPVTPVVLKNDDAGGGCGCAGGSAGAWVALVALSGLGRRRLSGRSAGRDRRGSR